MSGVIDKNVVKMVLDNTIFQKNAAETLSTLDKLKEALNFEGAVKGLENLSDRVKGIGMETLYNGVGKAQESFNALDIVAARVLQNITDKVQSTATDIAKKLTIEPLKAGLEEYRTQIDSVQTILANTSDALIEKGFTTEHDRIEKVNSVLDELNHYADMTIYNFTEMTRNIGTFTAAGVELDTAATAIQGIANLAAMSGSNSQQASTAMYQLSQAIASGTVKLQDWNSVVNAGMGGKLFQNELIDTAKAMGVVDEQFQQLTEGTLSFRESLSSGWITSEVLLNTLEKFTAGTEGYTHAQVESMKELWKARGYSEKQIKDLTGAVHELTEEEEKNVRQKWYDKGFTEEQVNHIMSMGAAATDAATKVKTFSQLLETVGEALQSGWTQSWEYIIGDFEQAKMLWTEVSDIMNLYIGKSADARNTILAEWSRAAYFYNEEGKLVRAVYNEAGELDKEASNQVVEDGKMIREEMGGRELVIQSLRNSFQGLFEIALEFGNAWGTNFLKKGTSDDISITAKSLKDLSLALYDFSTAFKTAWSKRDDAGNAIGLLGQLREEFNRFASSLRNGFDGIRNVFSGLGNIFKAFSLSNFFNIDAIYDFNKIFSQVTYLIRDFGEAFKKHFGSDTESNRRELIAFFNGIQKYLSSAAWANINFIVTGLSALGSVFDYLIEPFGTVSEILGYFGNQLSRFGDVINDIVKTDIGVSKIGAMFLEISNGLKEFIDTLRNSVDFSGFTNFFDNLFGALSDKNIDVFQIFKNVFTGLVDILKAFLAIATPVAAAFSNIFGGAISEVLQFIRELSDRFKDFTQSLVANTEVIKSIQTLFEGVFSVFKAIGEVVGTVLLSAWDSLTRIISSFLPDGKTLSETLTDIGEKLKEFANHISALVDGKDGVPKLSDLIGKLTDKFIGFFGSIKDINLFEKFIDLIHALGDGIKRALGGTEDMTLMDTIVEKIKGFFNGIKEILSDEHGNLDFVKVLEAGGIGVALKKLYDFIKDIRERTNDLKGIFGFIDDFKEILEGVAESFADWAKMNSIEIVAKAMLKMAASMFILAMIDPVALGKATVAMASMFAMIERVMLILSTLDLTKLISGASVINAVGKSILELAVAVKLIGSMDLASAIQGVAAIGIMMQMLVASMKHLSSMVLDVPKVAGAMIALAVALDLLIIPVKVLGGMDLGDLAKGLGAVALMMAGMVIAVEKLSKNAADMMAAGAGFVLMATAINILAGAVKKVSGLEWEGLAKGLAVFTVALGGMVVAAIAIDKYNLEFSLMKIGQALVLLGAAMDLLAIGLHGIAGLEWSDLGKGLVVFAVALAGLGVASHYIDGKNLLMIGGAIFLVATAVSELAVTLELAKVLAPLCTSLAFAIQGISDSLSSFARHAAGQAFLQFLQDAILFLPRLAVGLAQAVVELVAAFGAAAGKLVGAVVNIGKEILKGIAALLPGLFDIVKTFIAESIKLFIAEVPLIFEALGVFFDQLWQFLTAQVPNFFGWLTAVFSEGLKFLQTEGPIILETIRIIFDSLLQIVITEAPRIGEAFLALLKTLLDVVQTAIPEIVTTLLMLISELLQRLAEFVPQMAQAALAIILGFLQAVAENIEAIVEAGISIALGFIRGITEKMPEIVDAAFKLLIGFIDGLALAIEENHDALFEAIGHLIKAIVEAIIDGIGKLVDAAGKWFTGEDGEGGILGAIGSFVDDIFKAGVKVVQGFIDGLLDATGLRGIADAAAGMAQTAWGTLTGTLDENSPSKLTYDGGLNFVLGFMNGITAYSADAVKSVSDMAYTALNSFLSAISSNLGNISQSAISIATSFIGGIANMIPQIIDSARSVIANFIDSLSSTIGQMASTLFSIISNLIQMIVNGISQGIPSVLNVGGQLINQLINAFNGYFADMFNAGVNLVQGFINGMLSGLGSVWDAACSLANNAWRAITDTLGIKSPSRVAYSDGMNFVLGFVNGILDYTNNAAKVSSNMAYDILDSFDEAMKSSNAFDTGKAMAIELLNAFNSAIKSFDDVELHGAIAYDTLDSSIPSINDSTMNIRPVYDEDDIINGTINIRPVYEEDGIINGAMSINANLSSISDDIIDKIASKLNIRIDTMPLKLNDIYDVLFNTSQKQENQLNNMTNLLNNVVNNTLETYGAIKDGSNIYMDTGSLVGAIAPEMDQALGYSAILNGRGV